MEIEHINENTIRVIIKNQDLADRGITFLDLLGNHQETENFFYSILEEIDLDEEFRASEAVTFQVLPKGDGLELLITKNMNLPDLTEVNMENQDELTDLLKQHVASQLQEQEASEETTEEEIDELVAEDMRLPDHFVYEVAEFDQYIQLAKEIDLTHIESTIYYYRKQYFLDLYVPDLLSFDELDNELVLLSEYAQASQVTAEVLAEHGQLILKKTALTQLQQYF